MVENAIQAAGGVDHVVTGTLSVGSAPNPSGGTGDLILPGAFPLPTTSNGQTLPISGFTVVN
jgi:hypothetical protein